MTLPNKQNFILRLFLIALVLRLAYTVFCQTFYFFNNHPGDDVQYYQQWATNLILGQEPVGQAYSGMPLFAYVLAVLFKLCFGQWIFVKILNLILGAANCVLIYSLARNIFPEGTARIAGILAATNFILIYYDWLLMPVTLLIFLSLAVLIVLSQKGPGTMREAMLLGLVLGAACLGDGKFILIFPLLLIYLYWQERTETKPIRLKKLLAISLGFILVVGGVTLRNRLVSGEWIFISSQSGLSFYVGNNPNANGAYDNPNFIRPTHQGQDLDQRIYVEKIYHKKVTAAEMSDYFRTQALKFIREHPAAYLELLVKKIKLFFSDAELSHDIDLLLKRNIKLLLDYNSYVLMMPLAMMGLWFAIRNKKAITPLLIFLVAQFIFCLIFFVTTRIRAPIIPILIILESYALHQVIDMLQKKDFKAIFPKALMLVGYVVIFPSQFLSSDDYAFFYNSKAGIIDDEQKHYAHAIQHYQNALVLRPKDSNTLYNLATVYLHQQQYISAEVYFKRSIEAGGFNIDATFNLGYIAEQRAEMDAAIVAYEEVLKHQPESLDARYRLAMIYQKQGNCTLAQQYYQALIAMRPELKDDLKTFFKPCLNP